MQKFPTTVAQFRRQAVQGFKRANPEAADTLVITWEFGPEAVTFPTGITGFSGVAIARADGFKTKTIVATATRETGLMVR
jgi:hypothetical protein